MKILSFTIFGSRTIVPEDRWTLYAYMRGLYWNVRMAKLLFPDFQVRVTVDGETFSKYDNVFYGLSDFYGTHVDVVEEMPLCKAMLTRMKPIFIDGVDYVFCRDADSLITSSEVVAIREFIESGLTLHGINDNPAHSVPLLGGLCGFRCQPLRDKYNSWENLLARSPIEIDKRGSDQVFLTGIVYPHFVDQLYTHYGNSPVPQWAQTREKLIKFNPSEPYWHSDLCISFCGSAGVNDMETIRFFKQFDTENEFEEIAKRYPEIFYWKMP